MSKYYTSSCNNFSSVVKPLTDLLRSAESQGAFETIKQLLCSSPVLAAPNFSLHFKLDVDVSTAGAGAVLLQEDAEGIDHLICLNISVIIVEFRRKLWLCY